MYEGYRLGYMGDDGNFIDLVSTGSIMVSSSDGVSKVSSTSYPSTSATVKSVDNKPKFVDMFKHIKDYKIYGRTTVVYFTDGTKEAVVCSDEDNFDVEQGITMCVLKRMFGDTYKKHVRAAIKTKKENEKKLQKLEAANKEAKRLAEIREKKSRENKLKMKARYEARLAAAIEEEKKKLKNK